MTKTLYHFSARTSNKEPFPLPLNVVWEVYSDYLFALSNFHEFEIISFVLMNNHYHMLAAVDREKVGPGLCAFQTQTAKEVNRLAGRINHLYGRRCFRTEFVQYNHLLNTYKYILRNPVRAGLCRRVEEYPWSTLQSLLGVRRATFPIHGNDDLLNEKSFHSTLAWLNQPSSSEHEKLVRLGLRKAEFSVAKSNIPEKSHPIDSDRI